MASIFLDSQGVILMDYLTNIFPAEITNLAFGAGDPYCFHCFEIMVLA